MTYDTHPDGTVKGEALGTVTIVRKVTCPSAWRYDRIDVARHYSEIDEGICDYPHGCLHQCPFK